MSKDKPLTGPLTESELREKISTSRIVMAPTDQLDDLSVEVGEIMKALKQFGMGSAWVSDETCFSDFAIDADEYPDLSKALGIDLDPAFEDDWWLVKVAARMHRLKQS